MTIAHEIEHLVVGAGVTGLGFANAIRELRPGSDVLVLEQHDEPGGWCRTVKRSGFVWDYSGHFFHFRHKDIEAWLRARMPGTVLTVRRRARVQVIGASGPREVDFPFQAHTDQLDAADAAACRAELAAAASDDTGVTTFKQMIARRYGPRVCALFLEPYNEKLYACDLDALDRDAMGRFFPAASPAPATSTAPRASAGYNDTFTYPADGAYEYIRALLRDLPAGAVSLGERVLRIDVDARVAHTTRRALRYRHLVTSAPLPRTLQACGVAHDPALWSGNQVLVFNLGFDAKGRDDVHWLYFADRALSFYRVGFYDNIGAGRADRMSLYVEIGMPAGAPVDAAATLPRVLDDLRRAGVVANQALVDWHHVVMNPAYAHITAASVRASSELRASLAARGVHCVGRYGRWTYCSIEDNLVEARALAATLAAG